MCGIVGYIGNKKAFPVLIDGLLKLEYRGYDSSGVAILENNSIYVKKEKGRVKNLEQGDTYDCHGTVGIAHTRWATHGKPSSINSHPHLDNYNHFAVVHNGIIENYQEIKNNLIQNGYHFVSETDTEVIPNLISYYYSQSDTKTEDSFLQSVQLACKELKGSFAIEVISSLYPDTIIVVRKDSPLVIGIGENETYIASDIPAILSYTKNFYLLNDLEFAKIKRDKIEIYNNLLEKIKKEIKNIEWDSTSAQKDGYEDYMLKEIYEQPKSIRETIGSHLNLDTLCDFPDLFISANDLQSFNKIYMVACGTAMHAGLASKTTFESLLNIPVEVDISSEFRYRNPIIDNRTLAIFISQSGETADTIAALKLAKLKGAKTIAVSNVIGSSITQEASFSIFTHAGPEIAVASTKAYTSQIILLNLLAIHFAEIIGVSQIDLKDLKQNIYDLPSKISETLEISPNILAFAKTLTNQKDVFFIGRGIDYTVALEGSLKLKEISYIHSEAYAAGELKHGPIALIENNVPVISIITNEQLAPKTISNIQEVITRGATTLVITDLNIDISKFDNCIMVPKTHLLLSPILSIIPLQLLAYYVAKQKGLDVDKPRNLAKSVTVE